MFEAGKAGDWADVLDNNKLSAWSSVKLRECHSEVEQEDEDRKSITRLFLRKSAHFLRRIIVPVDGQEGVTVIRVPTPPISA